MIPIVRLVIVHLGSMQFLLRLLDEKYTQINDNVFLTVKDIDTILGLIENWKKDIKTFNLQESLKLVGHIKSQLELVKVMNINEGVPMTVAKGKHLIEELQRRVSDELDNINFGYIPRDRTDYFENDELFGKEVYDSFPPARDDIKFAGNCYAHGLYTACVFHLMRAVEHGLRKIARQLKVPFPATYELKTWEQLLKAIEVEIGKIILQPKTPKRLKDLKFYNPIPLEFRFFKDAWRNHVMHTRAEYDEYEAMRIMVHVKELMQHIAKGKEK